MAEVFRDALEPRPTPGLAADFGVECRVAEFPPGALARLLFRHAAFHELVDSLRNVRLDLVDKLAAQANESHDSAGRITLAMPSIMRSKLDTSLASCFRPAAVSL